jgi:hypothetical protein
LDEHEKQIRNWGMLCHLCALVWVIGVPLGNIAGPLIIWLLKKNDDPFIDEQGKESLNFQISMTIYACIAGILCFVLIGIPLLILVGVADLILTIVAAVKVSNAEPYRYPLTIRFFR